MNFPSSRATIPSGRSPSFVTRTIFVSASRYCAGSITKSNTSCTVTPGTTAVPSPRIMPASSAPRPACANQPVQARADGYGWAAMRRALAALLFLLTLAWPQAARAATAFHCGPPRCLDVAVPFPSNLKVPDDHVRILLPPNYDSAGAGYPVLYL